MEEELGVDPPDEIKNAYKDALKFIGKNKENNIKKNKIEIYISIK